MLKHTPQVLLRSTFAGTGSNQGDLKRVEIHDMVAEGDEVTTRKSFHATHKGEFFGIQPTNKNVLMDVIDIIRLRDGKYIGHWGILDLHSVMAQLAA